MDRIFSTQNQDILWNAFQKIPQCSRLPYEIQCNVFRTTLDEVYNNCSYEGGDLSIDDVQQWNRKLLQQLYATVKTTNIPPDLDVHMFVESDKEKTDRIFNEKTSVYKKMNEKPDVPKPSELFQEKQEEGKIQNMDEMIEKYQEQRRLEVPEFAGNSNEEMDKKVNEEMLTKISTIETRLEVAENTIRELLIRIDAVEHKR